MSKNDDIVARSDDDPDTILRITQDDQGDVWLMLSDKEKGYISFRACTMLGGGKNLELRKGLVELMKTMKGKNDEN